LQLPHLREQAAYRRGIDGSYAIDDSYRSERFDSVELGTGDWLSKRSAQASDELGEIILNISRTSAAIFPVRIRSSRGALEWTLNGVKTPGTKFLPHSELLHTDVSV
jgi:hypothetical protein